MKSHPTSTEVLEALGDKVVDALAAIVVEARSDLDRYRSTFPDFVADASERGLASWIHDRLWRHLVAILGDSSNVHIIESGPTREILVDGTYRLRIKRHDPQGGVTAYLTSAAAVFFEQLSLELKLLGETEVRLIGGYIWDAENRDIGPAVLSYRDGIDNVVWMVELSEPSQGASAVPISGPTTPPQPRIDISGSGEVSGAI